MQRTGVINPTDYPGAAADAGQRLTGLHAESPLISTRRGSGLRHDADHRMSRVVTSRSPAVDGLGPDVTNAGLLDDWRDAFNPDSPAFWVLLLLVFGLGLIRLNVQVGKK